MFSKVLVANRGEIALRVIRACRELGIKSVAIFSEADRDAPHVYAADEAFCVGPGPSSRSYMNIPNIISGAVLAGVDAIHPGYGYLSERAHFAEICETHGLKFIGPPVEAIERMGDKVEAKRAMMKAGVPVVPGSSGPVDDPDEAARLADEIGYPIMIKAAAGGGGRGMRVAHDKDELLRVLETAKSEAMAAFGSGHVYLERVIERPRHIEVQLLGDEHGHIIHLGERECSVQRRHQKVLEEAPSPVVDEALRRAMGEAAIKGAREVGYFSAGTVEFLLDQDGRFYFLEMNTRIQVEHPVTEWVTGVDIVKEQIKIAAGERLSLRQKDVKLSGHSIECRINAEDPARGFLPSPGRVDVYHAPGGYGVRVDSGVMSGSVVSPYYDPMLAKVIVHGRDRQEAIARAESALMEFRIEGIHTNIPFQLELLRHPAFRSGELSTDFLQRHFSSANDRNRVGEEDQA